MNEVKISKTGLEYFNVFDWLFENCKGSWYTIDGGHLFGKTNLEWKVYIEKIIKQNRNRKLDETILMGVFKFENPQDAMLFKLRWR